MSAGKLITVSFRLPFRFSVVRSRLVTSPSVGGLATALRSYFDNGAKNEFSSIHWIGVCDLSRKVFEKICGDENIKKDGITMHPVFQSRQMKEKFYDGFCNSVLWPLFLYFPSFAVYKKEFFEEYVTANKLMLEKILEVYEPGDTVWVHDYHWMLLPSLLREKFPDARIGFFLHIPFPSFELYRFLPKSWRTQIILGLMGADVIGFQTDEFVRHFVESVHRTLPPVVQNKSAFKINDRSTLVQSFSISIDYEKFNRACKSSEIKKNAKRIREKLKATKLILSVDRLDYTKAIYNRLEGFEMFLAQNPQYKEKVSYILLLVPTRESILKYKENKANVESLISRINGTYGTLGWAPIVYQHQSVDFKKLVALYSSADVALIVPSRDGMNLVAKEYISCRSNSDGVLILSETAGAASELLDAIIVNSNDRQEIADTLVKALNMSREDQKRRIEKMQEHIRQNDVLGWANDFLNSFDKIIEQVETEA
ncbi:MAG: trehalose-6-phosphate synthase [Bacteroidetes bacterium]|nr:trehalose-6-phosphate synthase [Bacteroidota bacterium]